MPLYKSNLVNFKHFLLSLLMQSLLRMRHVWVCVLYSLFTPYGTWDASQFDLTESMYNILNAKSSALFAQIPCDVSVAHFSFWRWKCVCNKAQYHIESMPPHILHRLIWTNWKQKCGHWSTHFDVHDKFVCMHCYKHLFGRSNQSCDHLTIKRIKKYEKMSNHIRSFIKICYKRWFF